LTAPAQTSRYSLHPSGTSFSTQTSEPCTTVEQEPCSSRSSCEVLRSCFARRSPVAHLLGARGRRLKSSPGERFRAFLFRNSEGQPCTLFELRPPKRRRRLLLEMIVEAFCQ